MDFLVAFGSKNLNPLDERGGPSQPINPRDYAFSGKNVHVRIGPRRTGPYLKLDQKIFLFLFLFFF
jgi:hypothetical protein